MKRTACLFLLFASCRLEYEPNYPEYKEIIDSGSVDAGIKSESDLFVNDSKLTSIDSEVTDFKIKLDTAECVPSRCGDEDQFCGSHKRCSYDGHCVQPTGQFGDICGPDVNKVCLSGLACKPWNVDLNTGRMIYKCHYSCSGCTKDHCVRWGDGCTACADPLP